MSNLPQPAGWYPDTQQAGVLRYWNGRTWTRHTAVRQGPWPPPYATPIVPTKPAPEPAKPPPQGLPGLPWAVFGFAMGFGLSILILFLLSWAGNPGGVAARLGLSEIGLWVGLLFPVFWVSQRRGTGSLATDFGLKFDRIDIGIGLLGAMAGRSAVGLVAIFLYPVYVQLQHQPSVGIQPSQITGMTWVVYGLTACIGAPIIEELLFRGLIQTRLVGLLGPAWGIGITSLLFGAAHLIGWQDPSSLVAALILAAGGLVLGFLRYRTGRLGTSMMAHAFFNLMAFVILILGTAGST